jgi:hypothetical protein
LLLQWAKQSANRWQDNLFSLESWCKKKFEGRENDIGGFFKDQGFNEDAKYFDL